MDVEKITWLSETDSAIYVKPSGNNIFIANCTTDTFDNEERIGMTVILHGLPLEVARAVEIDATSFLGKCASLDPSKPGVVKFLGCAVLLDIGQVMPRGVVDNTIVEYALYTGE